MRNSSAIDTVIQEGVLRWAPPPELCPLFLCFVIMKGMRLSAGLPLVILGLLFVSSASAAVDFEKQVAPILAASCIGCHGENAELGGVRVHARTTLGTKTSLGLLVVPGNPTESALYKSVALPSGTAKAMPPSGPLPGEQIEVIRQWILEGAAWPDGFVVGARKAPASFKDDLALAEAVHRRIVEKSGELQAAEMKPYSETIPATDVSIDFVPIPGGEFSMGTPDSEKAPQERRVTGPSCEARSVLDGQI